MTNAHVERGWLVILLATAVVALAVPVTQAEPAGTASPRQRSIAEILSNPVRDEMVRVRGKVVRRVVGNDYVLDDDTGKLIIDGGPIEHHSVDLPLNGKVEVVGEVSVGPPGRKEPTTPEIAIFSVTLPDGKVVQVRAGPEPPWAGAAH